MTSQKCQECGAMIAPLDVKVHDNWHDKMERRLQALERPGDHYRTFPQ